MMYAVVYGEGKSHGVVVAGHKCKRTVGVSERGISQSVGREYTAGQKEIISSSSFCNISGISFVSDI